MGKPRYRRPVRKVFRPLSEKEEKEFSAFIYGIRSMRKAVLEKIDSLLSSEYLEHTSVMEGRLSLTTHEELIRPIADKLRELRSFGAPKKGRYRGRYRGDRQQEE